MPGPRTRSAYPGGFALDARGWVWTTLDDGIQVYAPDRTKLGLIPMPPSPTNGCFGGPGLKRLTVAAKGLLLAIDLR